MELGLLIPCPKRTTFQNMTLNDVIILYAHCRYLRSTILDFIIFFLNSYAIARDFYHEEKS